MRNDNSNIAQNTHSSIYKRGKGKKKNAHLIIIIKSKKKGKEASVIRKKYYYYMDTSKQTAKNKISLNFSLF